MLYYFRNQKEGAGPCKPATCQWGPADHGAHAGGCLAGACAVPTVANVVEEVREIVAWLPKGRRLIVGFYATGHSSLGSPSTNYVREIIPTILDQPGVGGIMFCEFDNWFAVFRSAVDASSLAQFLPMFIGSVVADTMLSPCGLVNGSWPNGEICTDAPVKPPEFEIELCAKGCALRDAFAVAALGHTRRLSADAP